MRGCMEVKQILDGQEAEDCRNAMGNIVKQSLERNRKSILLRRATTSVDLTNVKMLALAPRACLFELIFTSV
jgi:hypothetical protein